jgi:hypothetical protein
MIVVVEFIGKHEYQYTHLGTYYKLEVSQKH